MWIRPPGPPGPPGHPVHVGAPQEPGFQWTDADFGRLFAAIAGHEVEAAGGHGEAAQPLVPPVSIDGHSSFIDVSGLSQGHRHGPFKYVGPLAGSHVAEPTFKFVGAGAGDFDVEHSKPLPRTYYWSVFPAGCFCCCCVLLPVMLMLFNRLLMRPVTTTTTPIPLTPMIPAYCQQGFDREAGEWILDISEADMAFCCNHFDVGCPTSPTTSQQAVAPTLPPTTTFSYDCDEKDNPNSKCEECIQQSWSMEKKAFCCRTVGKGCATSAPAEEAFDCQAGLPKWETGWSSAKKVWCCQHEAPVGCPGFKVSSPTTSTQATTSTSTSGPTLAVATDVHCRDFSEWPSKDGEADCGPCRHLVNVGEFRSCDKYCASFGHECFFAAEDVNGPAGQTKCEVLQQVACGDDVGNLQQSSRDMICGCQSAGIEVSGYEHLSQSCVNSHNIQLFRSKTVKECAALCDKERTCLGFEYGVEYGGGIGGYKPGDCQLSSSSDPSGCAGKDLNLDLYVKQSRPTEPSTTAPAIATPAPTPAPPAPVTCKDFSAWPSKDGNADCGPCKHLVYVGDFTSCAEYCSSFGQECFFAAEDAHGPDGQLDMVCGCKEPGAGWVPLPRVLPAPTPSLPPLPPVSCVDVATWPDRDGGVSCGQCRELVSASAYKSCGQYCQSFGQVCFYAAANAAGGDGCKVSREAACTDDLSPWTHETGDMICGCRSSGAIQQRAPLQAAAGDRGGAVDVVEALDQMGAFEETA